MKSVQHKIIASILLVPILLIILHGIIPHHHHDDLEHAGHNFCEQYIQHAEDDHQSHQHECPSHSANNFESCSACHFTIDAVTDFSKIFLVSPQDEPDDQNPILCTSLLINIAPNHPYIEHQCLDSISRRGPPSNNRA